MLFDELVDTALEQTCDCGELCELLEILPEELLNRFADKLLLHQSKFGVGDEVEQ